MGNERIFLNHGQPVLLRAMSDSKRVAIIGAGPAGLTAGYLLAKAGVPVVVLEAHPTYVGGISRTESYKGYHFDIGGHRFFSKSEEVEQFWTEILGNDMLERPRSSRIYYNHAFFSYPLNATEALRKLGIVESVRCVWSYFMAKLRPIKNPVSFEDWVTNQFGKRLFRIFFKTYTEKVWGIPCSEISADWAAQRIKGLSLIAAIQNALLPKRKPSKKNDLIKTLIDTFRYPKLGPGMMWEVCAQKMQAMGGDLIMGDQVTGMSRNDSGTWQIQTGSGKDYGTFSHVISSAPMAVLLPQLQPALPAQACASAKALKYRDFITVVLILEDKQHLVDNWIYIHDPAVKVGRVQNFKSWSPFMVPDSKMACYGLEYFCFEGDGLWKSSDESLIALGKRELAQIGLAPEAAIVDGYVVRQPKAYPVYDQSYSAHVETVRQALKAYPGLYLVGRNGMHKYNNQDHSMMTAMLAVQNIVAGEEKYDLWCVNQDAEYHESGERGADQGGRMIPKAISASPETGD
jgi:protoporphyrinogen oxidase